MPDVLCDYCGQQAQLQTGRQVYPHRRDLHDRRFYVCPPCDARVGCHPGTTEPLGRLANAALRQAKQAAHAAFDPLWQDNQSRGGRRAGRRRNERRKRAYAWLAEQLGIAEKDCHIGMFDVATCQRVVEICHSERDEGL